MLVIALGFLAGIAHMVWDLRLFMNDEVEIAVRQLLLDSISLLALVELFRTIASYRQEGRVRVRFIVDTVIIIMLNEVLSIWLKGTTFFQTAPLLLIIITLIGVRVMSIRYSPQRKQIKE